MKAERRAVIPRVVGLEMGDKQSASQREGNNMPELDVLCPSLAWAEIVHGAPLDRKMLSKFGGTDVSRAKALCDFWRMYKCIGNIKH